MKGSSPTKSERELWSRLAQLGCIACRKDGFFTSLVSIHHIDGRTKPGACSDKTIYARVASGWEAHRAVFHPPKGAA